MEERHGRMEGQQDAGRLQAEVWPELGKLKKADPPVRRISNGGQASHGKTAGPDPRVPKDAGRMGGGSFPMGGS